MVFMIVVDLKLLLLFGYQTDTSMNVTTGGPIMVWGGWLGIFRLIVSFPLHSPCSSFQKCPLQGGTVRPTLLMGRENT